MVDKKDGTLEPVAAHIYLQVAAENSWRPRHFAQAWVSGHLFQCPRQFDSWDASQSVLGLLAVSIVGLLAGVCDIIGRTLMHL